MESGLHVSVVMATYNGEKYVKEQLESIYNQSVTPDDLVIIDDCSSDSTYSIIMKEISKYNFPCILVRNDVNLGINASFYKGFSLSKGDLVFVSDQDDIWFHDKIETMLDKWDGSDLICSDAEIVNEELQLISKSELAYFGYNKRLLENYPMACLFSNLFSGHNMAVTRTMIDQMRDVEHKALLYDWAFFIHASAKQSLQVINNPLCKHRFHSKNAVNTNKYNKPKLGLSVDESYIERKKTKIRIKALLLSQSISYLPENLDNSSRSLKSSLSNHLNKIEMTIFNFSLFSKLYKLRKVYFHQYSGYSRFRVIKNICTGTKGYWITFF
jgi:glycosyltransferase involved in cell wall biosynthesis